MGEIKSYKDLKVWQKGIQIVKLVYLLSEQISESEKYNLKSQIKRSATSISSNIAEGYGRESTTDFCRFLRNARGSLFELETQLIMIKEVGLEFNEVIMTDLESLLIEENKMLNALIKSLNK